MSDLQNGAAITRTMEREFWNGIPVVAYHWNILDPECPIEGLRERHAIAYHWSTGPVDAARLISVKDVETYLSTPAPSDQAGWQDIASAPRDGTHFLATLTVRHINGHRWRETHLIWADDETGFVDNECCHGWEISDYEAWRPVPDFGPPTTPTLTAGEGGGS